MRNAILQDAGISKITKEKLDPLLEDLNYIMIYSLSHIGYNKLTEMDIGRLPPVAYKAYTLPFKDYEWV